MSAADKINCEKCKKLLGKSVPRMLKCGHLRCGDCFRPRAKPSCYTCGTCYTKSSFEEVQLYSKHVKQVCRNNIDLNYTVAQYEKHILQLEEKMKKREEDALNQVARHRREMTEIKEKMKKMSEIPGSYVRCKECENSDDEINMQICKNCSFETIANRSKSSIENLFSMKSFAICPTCALRKHVKNYHVVVDFFPVWSEEQFGKHAINLEEKRESHKKNIEELEVNVKNLLIEFEKGEEQVDRMTDMIRRSKTTSIQEGLVKKVAENMNKFNIVLSEVKGTIENETEALKDIVDKLSENNDEQDLEDCHEFVGDPWNSTALPTSVSFSETEPLLKKKSACWMVICEDSKKHFFKTEKDPVMSSECE